MINNNMAEELLINRLNFDLIYFEYPYYIVNKSTRLLFKEVDNIY
jgi:hypothetical protein